MAMKLATAYVDITARDAGFKREVNSMRSEIQGQVAGLAQMLGQLGIGAGLGAAVKGALGIASAAEQSEVAFNVIIKDLEKTKGLLAELNRFSVVTPFEPAEVRRAGQSLLAFRTEVEDIAPTLQILGDAAAGTGADLNDVVRIFNKVKSVGKLTGETFEQFAERGINVQAELQEMLGITGEEFIKLRGKGQISFDQVRAAMAKMTSEGGMFFEAMKKQSTTAAGLWSTLVGNVKALAEAFGKTLMPVWKGILTAGINMLNTIMALNESTGGLITKIAAATTVVAGFATTLMAARTAMKLLGITYKTMLIGTGWGVAIVAIGAVIGLVYKLISAIASSETVMAAWEANVAKFGVAWERIKTAAMNAWNAIKQIVMTAIQSIAGFFGIELDKMRGETETFAADAIGAIADWVLNAAEWIQVFSENWGTTWELIKNGAMILLLSLRDLFTVNLTTIIGYGLGRQLRLFVDFWVGVAKIAWKTLKSIGTVMWEIFKGVWQGIKNLFSGKNFGDVMKGAFDVMIKEASDFGEAFAAGWNKENPFALLEASSGLKAALAKQDELLGKLAGRKAELEAESRKMLEGTGAAGPAGPTKPAAKPKPEPARVEVKLEAGFFAFDQLQKSIQEAYLKGSDKDDKLVAQGDAAAIAREEMNRSLKRIEDKVGDDSAATATK